MAVKRHIRIATADVPVSFVELILKFVSDDYEIQLTTDRNAEYIFHSVGGHDVLKYSGVRIFVTGENVTPNFQISDYAMGFDRLSFGDRYAWMPLIKLYAQAYDSLKAKRPPLADIVKHKKDFCAYVMSNTKNSADERTKIFELLSSYRPVHSGGRWRNNVGGRVEDKLAFQSTHKFVIAFENSSSPGYLTEKFAEAAMAQAIPIYWGDPSIGELFNKQAFINCHDYPTLNEVLNRVIQIDQDETLYRKMLSEPWFPEGIEPERLSDQTFRSFLRNIFDAPHEKAFRRNQGRWGLKIEKQFYDMAHRPDLRTIYLIQQKLRALRKGNRPKL